MRHNLFMRILNAIEEHNLYFVQKLNACQLRGLSSLQKITSLTRMLAYGMSTDATDEYLHLGESTTIDYFNHFCQSIIKKFGDVYLRSPTIDDVSKLLVIGEARGFPEMGRASPANYSINGHAYNVGYYLTDNIYPPWAILVQIISSPQGAKKLHFLMMQ
ncbi:hypothetical protein RHMOL_Rhmol05G0126000 [Rhododendron molle]|uniref:Uncharacterized protein n=1 Tax=Rhododendron molle TaxID=49168 RepID=A0ACC0NN45_RHOML|nr:hypothetical protein RHMOL_Rhmol05G0126000 [Rhododendron molle]